MITHTFDVGWGPQWFLKKLEQELVRKYLRPLHACSEKVAVVNSTWYNQDYHQQVLTVLKNDPVDAVVLVAMLDSPVPQASWYSELDIPVFEVGYYSGPYELDFWAVMAHRYLDWGLQKYSAHEHAVDCAFMCLNRKPHPHRVKLFQQLQHHNLLDHGIVSLGGDDQQQAQRLLDQGTASDLAPSPGLEIHGIFNDLATLGDTTNWRRHFLNVVTETTWDIKHTRFVTEKIYKPIAGKRPFLLFDPDGGHTWLTEHGFVSYVDDFKDITELDLKLPENMAPFLSILSQQGSRYWRTKLFDLTDKMRYNRTAFAKHCQAQYQKINQGIQCQI